MGNIISIVSKYPGEKAYTESCYDDYNKISTIITASIDGRTLRTDDTGLYCYATAIVIMLYAVLQYYTYHYL